MFNSFADALIECLLPSSGFWDAVHFISMVVLSLTYEIIVRKIKVCEMEPLDKIEKQIYKKVSICVLCFVKSYIMHLAFMAHIL